MADQLKAIASSTAKLRELLAESKKDLHQIQLLLDALDEGLKSLWPYDASSTDGDSDGAKYVTPQLASSSYLWKEAVNLVASGRVIGIAAQADELLTSAQSSSEPRQRAWFGDGKLYTRWIGRGTVWMATAPVYLVGDDVMKNGAAQLLAKGMGIGYRDELVEEVTRLMILDDLSSIKQYTGLITSLKSWEQQYFLASLVQYFGKLLERLNHTQIQPSKHKIPASKTAPAKTAIQATAAFWKYIQDSTPGAKSLLIQSLSSNPSQNFFLSRSIAAALSTPARLEVLKKAWDQFADVLQIRHAPILSQETNARVLLLLAGYVHRHDADQVTALARSSAHVNAISERLKNSSERVRWLGMCVGMAISKLVDKEDTQMSFGMDDVETEEAISLRSLTNMHDDLGSINDLPNLLGFKPKPVERPNSATDLLISKPERTSNATKTKIIEIIDESDEEDDDLKPYAKPDSDEADSDEDAELVNRNKPKAPVYIRDLISWLSDTENGERHILALNTAGPLIRRKATFGSELHDRISELADAIVSLQDHFDLDDFHELKQEALTALIVAEPKEVGPWMIKTLFEGDLSVSQRVAIIVAVGVGGRELAGFKEQSPPKQTQDSAWPTKMLPGKLHELYSSSSNVQSLITSRDIVQGAAKSQQEMIGPQKIEALTRKMESAILNPVSTRQWSKPRPRTRLLKNDLTSIVADYFFFPLARYWQAYSLPSNTRAKNPLSEPSLAALALKTLTLLVLGAGPSAPSLPQTTKETFALLLSLRNTATQHLPVLEGLLFSLVAVLDLHGMGVGGNATANIGGAGGARWLAEECGKEIVEFREWVGGVWEKMEKAGSLKLNLNAPRAGEAPQNSDEETERCRVLTAKALVGLNEVVEKYQRLLVGELSRV